jgi:hypothetical protein
MNKGLVRSLDRRGVRSDKSPPVARRQRFSDPSICDRCSAVYTGKSWRSGRRLAREVLNRATIEAISSRIVNVEQRAQFTQPERRVVASSQSGKTLEVLTTSQKLAHRVAREVEKAFGGLAHFSWSDDDGSLLVTVNSAPSHAKEKKGK